MRTSQGGAAGNALGALGMFQTLNGVLVTWTHTLVKTHQIIQTTCLSAQAYFAHKTFLLLALK